jgi:hypothetical protein
MRRPTLVALVGVGLSCAHGQDAGETEALDHDVDLYWKALHWQDPMAGSVLVDESARIDWLRRHDKLEKTLSITSWEAEIEKIDPGGTTATAAVKITWYQLPSLVEQTEIVEQRWVKRGGKWQVLSEKGGPTPFP